MPRVFSVASWNVEHFGHDPARVQRVAQFLQGQPNQPNRLARTSDIFALYEVEGRDIYSEFMTQFPNHRFHLTEGKYQN